jgi:hypothetical protein
MTTTDLSKNQLATILSALDDRPRNPANRTEALKAIGKSAQRYGLSAEDVLAAAAGLLDHRLSPAEFRAELQDLTREHGDGSAAADAQEPAPAVRELAAAETAPEAADAPQDGQDADGAATSPEPPEPAPVAAETPAAGEPRAKAPGRRRERMAPKTAAAGTPAPRAGTKQALLITMLRRPEGATVEEVVEATGWQKHTVRGAISGALKKKLSLHVTSEKAEGRGRVYRIPT